MRIHGTGFERGSPMNEIPSDFYRDNTILSRAAIIDSSKLLPPNWMTPRDLFDLDVIDTNGNGQADAVVIHEGPGPKDKTWTVLEPVMNIPFTQIREKARQAHIGVVTEDNYNALNVVELSLSDADVKYQETPNSIEKLKHAKDVKSPSTLAGSEFLSLQPEWGIDVEKGEFIIFCSNQAMKEQLERMEAQKNQPEGTITTEDEVFIGSISLPIRK
jgi:hypothetical protein